MIKCLSTVAHECLVHYVYSECAAFLICSFSDVTPISKIKSFDSNTKAHRQHTPSNIPLRLTAL